MRREDAPQAGWYPDPAGGARLRWWDGLDWTDSWRSPGNAGAEIAAAAAMAAAARTGEGVIPGERGGGSAGERSAGVAVGFDEMARTASSRSRQEQEQLLADMRRIARAEVERLTGDLGRKAKQATQGLESTVKDLVDEYGPQVMRWLRRGVVAIVIGWIVFNVLQAASGAAQMTLFEWLGERLDAVTSTISLAGMAAGVPGNGVP